MLSTIMRALACGLVFVLLPGAVTAQRVVGRVVDGRTEAPLPMAEVRVESPAGVAAAAVTDSTGTFVIRANAGAGRYRVITRHLSYAPSTAEIELGAGDQVDVLIRMSVSPVELPPLVVVGRSRAPDAFLERAGYYERKGGRFGVFIDPEDIAQRQPLNTSDLFRNMSGVRVIMQGGLRGNDIRITRGEDPNCPPRVYIDRVVVRAGGRQSRPDDPTLDALIQPPNLHAIEVYRSPSEVPTEFGGNYITCGVVLIWTKRGAAAR